MTSIKNLLVLLFIFMLLGGYLYIYAPYQEKEKNRKLFNINICQVEEIRLERERIVFLFQKKNGKWVIRSPYEALASTEVVKGFLSLLEYGVIRVIDMNPNEVSQYGLEKPFAEFSIRIKEEDNFKTLLIGNYSPNGATCYAKIKGEPPVLLLGSIFRWELERDIGARGASAP